MFSGAGVNGLRRFFNTRPEFNEYIDTPRLPRRRSTIAHGGDITPGPMLDIDGIDDADVVEDDDMGDGSEIALDPGNFHQPMTDDNIAVFNQEPPPPPMHHPPPGAGFNHSHFPVASLPTFATTIYFDHDGEANPQSASGSANVAVPNGEGATAGLQRATPAPSATSGATAPSTAGVSIFGNGGSAAGPSTASLQGPTRDDGQNSDRT